MRYEYITRDVIELLKQENTKISKKILDVFDRNVCGIVKNDCVWWFEKTTMYSTIPNYMHDYLIGYIKRKLGLMYLREI